MFALISHALQPGRAENAAQITQAVTRVLLQSAEAGVSHLQELGRQSNSPNTEVFGESERHEIILAVLRQRQHQGSLNSKGFKD